MANFHIIPQPQTLIPGVGSFTIDNNTRILASGAAAQVAEILDELIGHKSQVEAGTGGDNTVSLMITDGIPDEGYVLDVTGSGVELRASQPAGLFYGIQTLRQLVDGAELPAVHIEDHPCFRWRGLHLDVGRHMFPVDFIKRYIDLMSLFKLNSFHWHLTEDQGWRIEIQHYPKLSQIASRRAATPFPANRTELDGVPYGGYYTQEEVKEVVAYASERFVSVVPEIEMPGHTVAVLAAYPELGCMGKDYKVRTFWGIAEDVFCAGNDAVFTFLENVLNEVLELFPSEYIHIGGDECPKIRWEECPKCQARIQTENLKDEYELQSYFIRRIETFLNNKGRRLIGWDEILEGGLAPNVTVMNWRSIKGGIEAATAGHDVVMTPNTHVYFDYYQSKDQENEPPAIGGFLPLEKTYQFNPLADVPADKQNHIIGGQGNVWTEYIPNSEHVEYMAYPRAIALAEAVWTASENRDYIDFLTRLRPNLARLDARNVNYRNPFD